MTIIEGLKLEWFKFRKNRVVIISIILLVILLPGIGSIAISMNIAGPGISSQEMMKFPEVWSWMAYISNWVIFFHLGYIFIYFITVEYDKLTLRQSIINGLSRRQFFMHKLQFILLLSFLYAVYYGIVSFLYGTILSDAGADPLPGIINIFYVFIVCVGYGSMGMFLAVVIRRTTLSLMIFLIYGMFLENILRHFVHKNILFNKSMHFYPVNVLEDLTPAAMPELLRDTLEANFSDGLVPIILTHNEALIGSLFYIALFLGLSYFIFQRSDL